MSGFPVPPELIVLAMVFAVDRLLTPRMVRYPAVFWPLVGVDLVGAGYVLILGLPGMEELAVVRWLIGLLLVFHAIQNIAIWNRSRDPLGDLDPPEDPPQAA